MTSVWWPVPARPSTWFSQEQLAASAAYHQPLARVATMRGTARLLGLVLAGLLCRELSPERDWLMQLAASSLLVSVAWWLPATASDWWFDQRHDPRFGGVSLPVSQLVVGSSVALVGTLMGVGLSGGVVLALRGTTRYWWLVVVPAVVIIGLLLSILQHRTSMHTRSLNPLPIVEDKAYRRLAEAAGIEDVSFWGMKSTLETGLNALTLADVWGSGVRIALTDQLSAAPEGLRKTVVAHELGHVRSGHLRQMLIVGLVSAAAIACVVTLALVSPWLWLLLAGVEPSDPRGLPALALVVWLSSLVLGLGPEWLARAQERQADLAASELVGPIAEPLLRVLHVTDRADLDPGRMSRLTSTHPPPAERLHRAELHHKTWD